MGAALPVVDCRRWSRKAVAFVQRYAVDDIVPARFPQPKEDDSAPQT